MPTALLIVFGFLVAVPVLDRLLALITVRRVAQRIAVTSETMSPPDVRVAGASFLAQLLAGRFREVLVAVPAFAAGGVAFLGLTARLTDVRAPLRELRAGGRLVAGRVSATTTIALSELDGRLPLGLTLTRHGGELRITGSVLRVPVSGVLGVTAEPRRICVTPRVLGVPSLLGFVIALPGLPAEMVIDSVRVAPSGLEVRLSGENVALGGKRTDLAGPAECLAS